MTKKEGFTKLVFRRFSKLANVRIITGWSSILLYQLSPQRKFEFENSNFSQIDNVGFTHNLTFIFDYPYKETQNSSWKWSLINFKDSLAS